MADAAATGSVTVTPAGAVQVNLVSLSRVFGSSALSSYRLPLAARLELVFLAEPASPALLLAAAASVAALAERKRRRVRAHSS